MQCTCTLLVLVGSSKKQIPVLARVRTAGAPQGLPRELHFPLGAHGTELQWLSGRNKKHDGRRGSTSMDKLSCLLTHVYQN